MPNVVTEATGTPISASTLLGFHAEGARTNRCLQSEEFDEAVWVSGGGGITVDDQSTASPDGATTADTLTASGANGTLIQDLGVVASAAKTFSIYLKRKTGTGNIDMTMDGGATWTTKTITASWARYSVTQTLADEDVGIRVVTSGDEVYAWGAQVETASFASSYVPTTTVAVARNEDSLSYPSASNLLGTVGTIYCEAGVSQNVGAGAYLYLFDIGAPAPGNRDPLLVQGGAGPLLQSYDGTSVVGSTAVTLSASPQNIAITYGGSARKLYLAGSPSAGLAFDGDFNIGSGPLVGLLQGGGGSVWGTIRNVRFWLHALSDSQVKAIS